MKKVVNTFFAITVVFLLLGGVTVQAQKIDFEDKNIGDTYTHIGWSATDITAEVAADPLSAGNKVLKCTVHNYNAAPVLAVTLPAGKTLADYSTFKFKGYFAQGDVGWKDIVVEAYQTMPTGQFGNVAGNAIGKWNRAKGGSTAWEDISIGITGSASLTGTIYLAFGINCNGTGDIGGTGVPTIWYADDIELVLAPYVTQWGKTAQGTAWPILWNNTDYEPGDAGIGDGEPPTAWATIKGGFPTLEATTSQAVVVTGEMELVGGGGASAYTWLRYALTYQDSVELKYQGTDSATWVTTADSASNQNKHWGYGFHPRSGNGTMSNGAGGAGVVWTINKGSWSSTWSNNGKPISAVKQAPRNAEAIAGTYKFAISVQPKDETTNEIRWYLIEKNNKYWFGGTVIETATTTKFNGICFGFNNDIEATQVNFYKVKVDLGAPITVPEAPWEAYYVSQWGFSGGNLGGWDLIPGDMEGDVEISGTAAPTGWAALRGGFDPYELNETYALKISGQIELVGGGFQDAGSLRYGIFYSDSAGTTWQDSTLDSNWVWKGTDRAHSGYLITPPSGSNVATWSNGKGTWGSVTNGKWWDISAASAHVLGNIAQDPVGGVAGAGIYDFTISISKGTSGNLLVFTLSKKDGTYYYAHSTTTPVTSVTDKINSIGFAINNSTTTALKLYKVKVDRGDHFNGLEEAIAAQLPKAYALKQNYPNPFNPTTNIRFDLKENGDVSLVVYDLMGREVAKLVNGPMNAGYYTINFNAANLPSGVYIYRLKAGDFVNTKKLMLLK